MLMVPRANDTPNTSGVHAGMIDSLGEESSCITATRNPDTLRIAARVLADTGIEAMSTVECEARYKPDTGSMTPTSSMVASAGFEA